MWGRRIALPGQGALGAGDGAPAAGVGGDGFPEGPGEGREDGLRLVVAVPAVEDADVEGQPSPGGEALEEVGDEGRGEPGGAGVPHLGPAEGAPAEVEGDLGQGLVHR